VRLLLPFQLESPLSLQPQLSEPAAVTEWAADLPATDYEPVTNLSPSIQNEPIQHEAPLTETKIEPETAITILWGCGILAVLLYVCISYGVLRYRVRDAIKCPESVWESDRIGGAFLLGYFQPKIYIPAELNLKDRRFILAHEQSHLKRGDHWWKLLGMVCLSIHWYNPLVWLGYALLCRDIEVACDEHVIRDLELEERKSYSFALLSSGKRLSGFLAYPVAFGEISLKSRIKNVLNYRKPGIWITAAAVTLTLTVAVCFMTNPTTAARSQPEEKLSSVQATEPTTEEPTAPTTEALIPTESETLPPAETTASTEPVTDPTEATVPPAASVIKPTAPPPTKPTVIPTVPPATKPTEPPVTTPTNPPITEPTQPEVTVPPTTAPTQPPVTEPEQSSIGGSCGENVVWEYNEETRQLTIRGSGPMVTDNKPPWEAYKSKILSVSISNGITSISPYAFYNCTELRSISIPGSVATIEERAFCGCEKLQTVRLSEGLQIIGAEAFDDSGIKSIVIPKTVILIESGAFSSCDSLTQITFTGAPPKMEVHTFLWTTATAYYPEYTGTWRSALYDYGGNITWELCCTNHSYINGVCERCGSKKGA
jgi:beta-lactamase regulating signal transducer with metallopeptidase domain